ncbi:hypothetical protein ACGF07_33745 [Kitasatospora sp. NPDC048194]|uniref:hypothetical protein n=1 Tax=Kitasatospora sp. NPDC048194 TaxID=3364045 RepID=UPI003715CC3F
MQLAIDCAGFTPTEADKLRQAMGSKRSHQRVAELRERLLAGMAERGIPTEVAEDVYAKIDAFSSYGFPDLTPLALPCWCTRPPGSSTTTRRRSPAPCWPTSRWASTPRSP